MKYSNIALAALLLTSAAGCKKPKPQPVEKEPMEVVDTTTGIVTLREFHVVDSISIKGSTYKFDYEFLVDNSRHTVRNQAGYYYKENLVNLSISRNSQNIFSRTFKKEDFNSIVPEDMMQTSTLVGFTYNYTVTNPDALYFIATVGDPDISSDDLLPMDITITTSGEYSVRKAENIDTGPVRQGMTVDPDTDEGV